MIVADLELDLDVFQGPFDLLLALILREEVELAEVPIAEIIAVYLERAYERGELDLESASEFLVLVAALLEIKVRLLFPSEDELEELTPEQAEAELFARLIEYRRFQGASRWLRDRIESEPRIFRIGPAPLAPPRPEPLVLEFSEDPWRLLGGARPAADRTAADRRLVGAPAAGAGGRLPGALPRVLRDRRAFAFEDAVRGLDRLSQAAAFLAVLELVKRGEVRGEQTEVFGPIRVVAGTATGADRAIA